MKAPLKHGGPRSHGQQGGPLGRILVRWQQLETRAQGVERLARAVEMPLEAGQARHQDRRLARLRLRVEFLECRAQQRLRAAALAAKVVILGRTPQQVDMAGAGDGLGVRDAAPQLKRALEQRGRLAGGAHRLGRRRGVHARRERGTAVAGREVVGGDRGAERGARIACRRPPLQGLSERPMQIDPLAGQQVVLHHFAQQRVAERVAAFGVHDHEVAGDRRAQALAKLARVQPGGLGEQVVLEPTTDREHAQELLRAVGQVLDPQYQRVAQRAREHSTAVAIRRQQLLHEQRVALRARVQAIYQLGAGRGAQGCRSAPLRARRA